MTFFKPTNTLSMLGFGVTMISKTDLVFINIDDIVWCGLLILNKYTHSLRIMRVGFNSSGYFVMADIKIES